MGHVVGTGWRNIPDSRPAKLWRKKEKRKTDDYKYFFIG
jgi:hypothetical protein